MDTKNWQPDDGDPDFGDLHDMSFHIGTIVAVDTENNLADVNIAALGGLKTGVEIFYNCEDQLTAAGATAFAIDDEVYVTNKGNSCNPAVSDLTIIGFTDAPRACNDEMVVVKCQAGISAPSATYVFVWDVGGRRVATEIPASATPEDYLVFPVPYADLSYWLGITESLVTSSLWTETIVGQASLVEALCSLGTIPQPCGSASCESDSVRGSDRPGKTDTAAVGRVWVGNGGPQSSCPSDPCIYVQDRDEERYTYALLVGLSATGHNDWSDPPIIHGSFGSKTFSATTGPWTAANWSDMVWVYHKDRDLELCAGWVSYYESATATMQLRCETFLGFLHNDFFVEWQADQPVGGQAGYATYTSVRLSIIQIPIFTVSLLHGGDSWRTDKTGVQMFLMQSQRETITEGGSSKTNREIKCIAAVAAVSDASVLNPFTMTSTPVFATAVEATLQAAYDAAPLALDLIRPVRMTVEIRTLL